MKLLVFASTPPPVHGQSLMVQMLVEGLAEVAPDIAVHHVNPRLSRDAADIGRWRVGKLVALVGACVHALRLRVRHGTMTFYYVPAPAKRSALYRDLIVMLLCRPWFESVVLHWHAVGLGSWLATHATFPERWLARALLGGAELAIVLAPELIADAQLFSPRRVAIVPNGIAEPNGRPKAESEKQKAKARRQRAEIRNRGSEFEVRSSKFEVRSSEFTHVLFLGLCSREKGLFDTLTAVAIANQRVPGGFRLTVAGGFASERDEQAFHSQAATLGADVVRYAGFVDAAQKHALFAAADVFCFPTTYAHEGQPLALIEALAHDVPIVTTRWRAIPSMLPVEHVWFVEPGRPDQLAAALLAARESPPPSGQLRQHYLAHFTREQHLATLAAAIFVSNQTLQRAH